MNEKIVVPLDGSVYSEAVLPYLEKLYDKLAQEVGLEVVLLQVLPKEIPVIEPKFGTYGRIAYTEEELANNCLKAEDYLEKAGESLKRKGILVTICVEIGSAAEKILAVAEKTGADLIAISSKRRFFNSNQAMGRVAEMVLNIESGIPVLVVKV